MTEAQKVELERQVDVHFERAKKAFRAEDFPVAISEYDKAYSLDTEPIFLFNTGQAYRRWGRYKDAIGRYRLYLTKAPELDNPHRIETLGYIRELTGLLADQQRPTWKKGWFWAIMSSATVGVALAVGLGVGFGLRDQRTVLNPGL